MTWVLSHWLKPKHCVEKASSQLTWVTSERELLQIPNCSQIFPQKFMATRAQVEVIDLINETDRFLRNLNLMGDLPQIAVLQNQSNKFDKYPNLIVVSENLVSSKKLALQLVDSFLENNFGYSKSNARLLAKFLLKIKERPETSKLVHISDFLITETESCQIKSAELDNINFCNGLLRSSLKEDFNQRLASRELESFVATQLYEVFRTNSFAEKRRALERISQNEVSFLNISEVVNSRSWSNFEDILKSTYNHSFSSIFGRRMTYSESATFAKSLSLRSLPVMSVEVPEPYPQGQMRISLKGAVVTTSGQTLDLYIDDSQYFNYLAVKCDFASLWQSSWLKSIFENTKRLLWSPQNLQWRGSKWSVPLQTKFILFSGSSLSRLYKDKKPSSIPLINQLAQFFDWKQVTWDKSNLAYKPSANIDAVLMYRLL